MSMGESETRVEIMDGAVGRDTPPDPKTPCDDCGMETGRGEYHPQAACVLYRETKSPVRVVAMLAAVLRDGRNRERRRCERLAHALTGHSKPDLYQLVDAIRATGKES